MFTTRPLDSSTMQILESCYEKVWQSLHSKIGDSDAEAVRAAIAEALFAMAHAGQLDRDRLTTYALSKARAVIGTHAIN